MARKKQPNENKAVRIAELVEGLSRGVAPMLLREAHIEKWKVSGQQFTIDFKYALKVLKVRTDAQRPYIVSMLRSYSMKALDIAVKRMQECTLPPSEVIKILEYIGKLYSVDSQLKPTENAPEPLRILLTHATEVQHETVTIGRNNS